MDDIERVIGVDVAVYLVRVKSREDMRLERVGWLHYEGVEIEPPKPVTEGQ